MLHLSRLLHLFASALWFGAVVFFTIAGLLIFQAFEDLSRQPAADRPLWLPLPQTYDQPSPVPGFPDPLRLEQGSRLAGVAVSRIFPVYYALQVGCGVVALLTALILSRFGAGSGHRVRSLLCLLALLSVLGGWWLEHRVSELRVPRNEQTDVVLTVAEPSARQLEEARQARAAFGRWHGYSLIQNFVTLLFVTGIVASITRLSAAR